MKAELLDLQDPLTQRALERERAARKAAEGLLEQKSRELYNSNQSLRELNGNLEESELRYRTLMDLVPDAIWIEKEERIVYVNAAALELFGADAADALLGTPAQDRIPIQQRAHVDGERQPFMTARSVRSEMQVVRLDGRLVDVEHYGCVIRYNNEAAVMRVAHDITERRQHEREVRFQATHDQLTGLPNRAMFLDRLEQAIARARRAQTELAVMFIDLDRFKDINDTLGHAAGDELLRIVAHRLAQCVRESDTVARLGGDEFVLLLDLAFSDATPEAVAERLSASLGSPMTLGGQTQIVTASIGISLFPGAELESGADLLMRQADIAMYRSKESGRNAFHFFTQEMQRQVDARVALEQGMRRALKNGEFVLHYQPQVEAASGRLLGFEALIRWQSPELGLVSPARFIPMAEESNLILAIGEWVLHRVCSTLRRWLDAGYLPVPVAVNIAARQMAQQNLDTLVASTLRLYNVAPSLLSLEITESMSMADPEASIALMGRLRALGVTTAIDDFGTGYSNLSYLRRFPVDKLKIDQSFIQGLSDEPEDCSIVEAVIHLAHTLNLRVIAEGVESVEQTHLLADLGCDEFQGYYVGRPMPEADIVHWLPRVDSLA